ncbi:HD domain-containing protein [Desulfuromonas carbonis]|uniref:3'-5' exoribonuclease YhaM family protein n=1 Tax=Desulfuromonas sp. DDH964 TaxID=1823759 RepID=UPI00078C0238|nr:HD domain-containing protein [Desulfuromonas sp. DDH964]AMV71972.1 3'-to-5' exonuclease YhaM [Desulfuromonas sp. DDH964]
MKKIFVEQIRERDWVESPFLVRDKIMAMAKNGKPYMTLKLIDRSGEVEGRVWDRVDELAELFERDDFLLVKGKASVYMGKMQLVIQELERLPENNIDLADFLPVAPRDAGEMLQELRTRVASLSDPHLRGLLEDFLADPLFLQRYTTAPAAKAMHHVYIGGLLEHSLAVAALADDVCRRYPGINHDLLVAGALLHDVGKVAELSYVRSFDYTDDGKLLGHIVIGVEMIEERLRRLPDFPRPLATLLKHLLLSHHGQYEYGSPKRPKTLEAVILNFIDDLDSKINGVRTHIEREPDSESSWTSYHRLYDRYFFKGSEAPRKRVATAPVPPAKPAPPAAAPAENRPRFGTTLGEQLKGKSLDLFATPDTEKE